MSISTEKDLAQAMERGDKTIEIVGELAKKIRRRKTTERVAWVITLVAVGIAAYGAFGGPGSLDTTVPLANLAAVPDSAPAIGMTGAASTAAAVAAAIAAENARVLKRIRTLYNLGTGPSGVILTRR